MIEDEAIDMKDNSKQKINKRNLTTIQKVIIVLILFLLLTIIYNINILHKYLLSNINTNNNLINQDLQHEQKSIKNIESSKRNIKKNKHESKNAPIPKNIIDENLDN
jgi:predicted Holliday junction resolvase-like endonuclease